MCGIAGIFSKEQLNLNTIIENHILNKMDANDLKVVKHLKKR